MHNVDTQYIMIIQSLLSSLCRPLSGTVQLQHLFRQQWSCARSQCILSFIMKAAPLDGEEKMYSVKEHTAHTWLSNGLQHQHCGSSWRPLTCNLTNSLLCIRCWEAFNCSFIVVKPPPPPYLTPHRWNTEAQTNKLKQHHGELSDWWHQAPEKRSWNDTVPSERVCQL